MPDAERTAIRIRGARQNNLKNIDLDLPVGELTVVTGVSGSGKSSLVFDTLYAEGQRRYVETFSPYARQFLDRMDKPQVERIDGVPPAIAIDQANPVRTSRSTVGTMTELNDHLKLLYARAATLHCRRCERPVRRDGVETIRAALGRLALAHGDPRLVLSFPVPIRPNFTEAEVLALLERQGYSRIHERRDLTLQVVQDRFRWSGADLARQTEAIEAALRLGDGRIDVYALGADGAAAPPWRFSTGLHCPDCDLTYAEPTPSAFSFNSPLGACETCRGFGRTIGVDYALVIPDEGLSLSAGAIKPWQTPAYAECQRDLLRFAKRRGKPLDVAWRDLSPADRAWVIDGEGDWNGKLWYGVGRFFTWLESKAYKMHIRVLLARYRSYTPCAACGGARLKPDSLLWRIGTPGANIRELALLPIDQCLGFFERLELASAQDQALKLLLEEIRTRLRYLCEVGVGYLNLDRQARTLSGGEVQRINLTTALGTSLVNTLFVLDEPSIGLHARDVGRIAAVMRRLRDAGNTLVVVEHDPKIMHAADRILDIGPGPGEHGGEVVFFGSLPEFALTRTSLTADYLFGRKRAAVGSVGTGLPASGGPALRLEGAAQHNLRGIDVEFPLRKLVCVTGVSGSGKSTLVHDVLYRALLRAQGRPTEAPGPHRRLCGAEAVGDVVMVDQNPIGRTTRSNPASFVGAFDAIRKAFAALPEARARKYTAGTFSFNAGNGRCPGCGGNGFEHVEMQFLADVYLRCPDCDGRRYRREVLEVRLQRPGHPPASIADVLEMTVSEALGFFAADPRIGAALEPLAEVGLDYLRLGQPVPTLSGGEAQRLKLAAHLAARPARLASSTAGSLFIFDEPTTGLHFEDIAKLLRAFARLLERGHSLLVIEHNLDVIGAADWIIDLGPEGGDGGGHVVGVGTPRELMAIAGSHTGRALAEAGSIAATAPGVREVPPSVAPRRGVIEIHGAREHNLQNIDVCIDTERFTVITGVSGSGKSTLAFDIVFAEGQRRYLESLNAYARQFVQPAARPDVDAIRGIPPTVAIEQRTSRGGCKSTVATLTEIHHFLRLLYVKLGLPHCPDCRVPIEPQTEEAIGARLLSSHRGRSIELYAPLISARKGLYTALAKWARNRGFAALRVDGELLPTAKWPRIDRFVEHDIELPIGTIKVSVAHERELRTALARALEFGRGVVIVEEPGGRRADGRRFSTQRACPNCGTGFAPLDPRLFSYNSRHGWCTHCFGTGLELPGFDAEQSGEESAWNADPAADAAALCPECGGRRLNPLALAVTFRDRSIAELANLSVDAFAETLAGFRLQGR
ncbi:MAG: excinuclease ABC subunit UvrA, partial [Steroidobacteraceae bacterium]|nr:excinuclease ABC subunit UvrA [Steroidobacteraceae bacterium]